MNNIKALLSRELKIKTRWKPFMISLVLPPLVYLIFLGTGFSRNYAKILYNGIEISYLSFLIPGIIVMQIFNIFAFCSSMVSNEVKWGIYKLFKLYNVKEYEYLVVKILSEGIIVFLQVIGILIVGSIINPDFIKFLNILKFVLLLLFVFVSLIFMVSLGVIFGFLFPGEQKRSFFLSIFTLPVTFCSSIFYPIQKLPLWFKIPAYINPLTHISDTMRNLLFGIFNLYSFISLIIIVFLTILSFFVGVRLMKLKEIYSLE